MTRLGITGHQSIPEAARDFVMEALEREIESASTGGLLWGITSLAVGADQLFAELVHFVGGRLHVVLPSSRYENTFDSEGLSRFRALLALAPKVERLQFDQPSEESFLAAGRRVVDLCDTLLAVWDGKPSRGLGGTADIVQYAQASGRRVGIIWPADVAR